MLKDYLYQLNENIKRENLNITIIERFRKSDVSKTKSYLIKCNKCGFDSRNETYKNGKLFQYTVEEYNLKNLSYCPCCNFKVVQVGINDIPTTAPWMVDYFQGGHDEAKQYSKSSTQKLFFKCPNCNLIKHNKTSIQQLYKVGKISCTCSDGISLPEKIMYYLLLQNNEVSESFKYQYSPKWCQFYLDNKKKRGIYDFYFQNSKGDFVVEMDGNFHYEKHFKDKSLEEQKEIDYQKNMLALKNNMTIIRIDCKESNFEYIKENILKSELISVLNLHDVNWDVIKENCYKNIIKLVCLDYANGSYSTIDLSKKYHMCRGTIITYLHIGNENDWCEYNGGNKKKVYQYTLDGEYIKCWDSCNEAIRQTGITSINHCLLGKTKQSGGYLWTYERK